MQNSHIRTSANGRVHSNNAHKAALLCSAEVREQATMLTAEDMTYVRFAYNPRFPALEQRAAEEAWTPAFPATTGRIAYCNGRYISQPDTSVTYRRGRRVVTEWHALARIASS